jgi:peptidoglycan/LPS O-acetylase OafA/YrhL
MLKSNRLPLIDSTRGLLSLGVASFHASMYAWDPNGHLQGDMFQLWNFLRFGNAVRVPLFFCISGFVLTLALSKLPPTCTSYWTFFLRRLTSITPMWWISIAFGILVEYCFSIKHRSAFLFPALDTLICNMAYLNKVLSKPSLNYAGYTLCIEVQLYIVITLLAIITLIAKSVRHTASSTLLVASSIFANAHSLQFDNSTWLIGFWPWFAIGSLCYLRTQKHISREFMTASVLSFGLSQSRNPDIERGLLITSTIIVIYGLSEFDLTSKIWNIGRQFTFLSRYSFALFLLHIKFVSHGITFDKARAYLGLHPNFTFFILVLLPLLLAIAITPVMNRIDKFLMAKLFPPVKKLA